MTQEEWGKLTCTSCGAELKSLNENHICPQQGVTKSCSTCRHVETCYLFRMAAQGIAAFNAEAKDPKGEEIAHFPIPPEAIAVTCKKYESPLDVIKKTEIASV